MHVAGAKLSGGDLHFSQGDGEITFCGAIEMGGFIDFGVELIKGAWRSGVSTNPIMPGNVEPRYSEFISFVGVSVDHDSNTNYYMNATLAYKRLPERHRVPQDLRLLGEQAYLLLGSAPVEGRISGIVDIPNACCSLYVPTAIFDFDIRPTAEGPRKADRGQCAVTSSAGRRHARRGEHHSGVWPPWLVNPAGSDSGGERNTMADRGAPQRAAESWATMAERNPAVGVVDTLLRGVGQVMFQNNPLTGLLFLVGIFVNSAKLGGAGLLGLAASTLAAYLLGADRSLIRAGLFGFNGILVGIAPAFFFEFDFLLAVYIVLGAAVSTVVMMALINLLTLGHAGADRPLRAHRLAAAVRGLPVRLPPPDRADRPATLHPGIAVQTDLRSSLPAAGA